MDTRFDFRLNFTTDRNAMQTLTIPRAEPNATPAQVASAMTEIIQSSVVQSAAGEPRFRHSAELVTTNRTEINI